MKKMLAGLLAVLTFMCVIPLSAFAAEPEDETVKPHFSSACPICTTPEKYVPLNIISTWTESTYYYTRLWGTLYCEKCGYMSNEVLSEVPNQTTRKKDEDKNENSEQIN